MTQAKWLSIWESKIADMSAIDALNKITERYAKINKSTFKTFKYGLSSTIAQCWGSDWSKYMEDPTYKVAVD
jgi:SulP family sulfate permease